MTRPPSIILFERLYLGSLVIYAVNSLVFWNTARETVAASREVQATPGLVALLGPIMIGALIVTVLATVLFWYLVARKRSVAGKWLVVITEAIGAVLGVLALIRLVSGNAANPVGNAIGLVATGLAVAAAVVLFRPDTRSWFVDDVSEGPRV